PHLTERNESTEDFAALRARAGIVDGDAFSAAKIAGSFCRRAGPRALVLLAYDCGCRSDNHQASQADDCQTLLHSPLLNNDRQFMLRSDPTAFEQDFGSLGKARGAGAATPALCRWGR